MVKIPSAKRSTLHFFMKNLRNGKNMTEPQIMSIFPKPQLNRVVAITYENSKDVIAVLIPE